MEMSNDKSVDNNATTIYVKTETRDWLKQILAFSGIRSYDELITTKLRPLLEREAKTNKVEKLAEFVKNFKP